MAQVLPVSQTGYRACMTAADFLPERRSLTALREAAAACRGCALWHDATQTVFGEGPATARAVLVGEVPGDQEDRQGHPFVGPAGRELDRALEAAGLARDELYLTNAVKHFKFDERGKRRIHQRPSAAETSACRPWVHAELEAIAPAGVLALGALAAKGLLGSKVRVTVDRGRPLESDLAGLVMVTVHPSSILRADSDEARWAARDAFQADVRAFAAALGA